MNKENSIDCVEMTRKIRDELYEEHKHLAPKEFIKALSEEGKKTELWKKLKNKPVRIWVFKFK